MVQGDGGKDSFEIVREFLHRMEGRAPRREEVAEIAPALHELYRRLMRVRAVAPKVNVSDEVWGLMEMVGIQVRPNRRSGFGDSLGIAATL